MHSVIADDIKTQYSIDSLEFNASSIYPKIKDDFIIFHFDENQHHKAFTSENLITRLRSHGITVDDETPKIIHVQRTSDINLQPIIEKIKSYYRGYYPNISIEKISLDPNGFIGELPANYTLVFKPKAYLYNQSSIQVTSAGSTERYFFTYRLDAKMKLFKARHNINRGKILTQIDLLYKSEKFTRLKALPLQELETGQFRLKKRLAKGKVLYAHDIESLPYVLKGKPVNVQIISGKVRVEFIAKSLEDGQKGAYVFVEKTDGKKMKARVINRNLVEVE
jgi:flagella basal body P-ring formation protein FlgA